MGQEIVRHSVGVCKSNSGGGSELGNKNLFSKIMTRKYFHHINLTAKLDSHASCNSDVPCVSTENSGTSTCSSEF